MLSIHSFIPQILSTYVPNSMLGSKKACPLTTKKTCQEHLEALGFPGGAVVKNPPASAGDTGSIPGPGRSHMPRSN